MKDVEFRNALTEAGLTQAQFARLSGLNPVTVNKWCRGKRKKGAPPWTAWVFKLHSENRALTELAGDRAVYS